MFKIINPKTKTQIEEYYKLRWLLLRRPLGGKRGSELDKFESNSLHRAIVDNKNLMVGIGRIHLLGNEAQIRYMAIKKIFWRKGLGTKMMVELESIAQQNMAVKIFLNSRVNAIKFYQMNGFSIIKEAKSSFGLIVHYRMEKLLEKS